MNSAELLRTLDRLNRPRALVVGDLILDCYTWGNAERISPEAPVIVLTADRRESRLGGAADVAQMFRGLGGDVVCAGVVGRDRAGEELRGLLAQHGIGAELVATDHNRPTTVKERFMGRASTRHPNQMLRVDHEVCDDIPRDIANAWRRHVVAEMGNFDAVLIADYGKGVCTQFVVRQLISAARQQGVPILIDPAREADYARYAGASVIKPNRAEAAWATGRQVDDANDALTAGRTLCERLHVDAAIITLDQDGMALISRDGPAEVLPTQRRQVYDITGAGDMVLTMLGVCVASGVPLKIAAQLANVAAGLEVERCGATVISRGEVRRELVSRLQPGSHKIISDVEEAGRIAESCRKDGKRLVFTNGCFDLLHAGHVSYLCEAAALGDVLMVSVNSDASVRRLKGPARPVLAESHRVAMLAALSCVDFVFLGDDDTPHRILEAVRPDVLVKGGDYQRHEVVGREIVEAYGGQVRVVRRVEGISTTQIVESLQAPPAGATADRANQQIALVRKAG